MIPSRNVNTTSMQTVNDIGKNRANHHTDNMSKTIHTWKRISLVEQHVALPSGKRINHTTIQHPGAAVMLPIADNGDIIVIRQFRPALNKWLLELPAGTMEEGESALDCAQRELEEETGYSASEYIALGQLTPMAGFCDEIQHLFIARHLEKTQRYQCDDDEEIEVEPLSVKTLERYIVEGKITDAKTLSALYKARLSGYI